MMSKASASLPVSFSVPRATAINKVLQKYTLTAPVSCQFWGSGINQTYRVNAGKKIFFLRLCRHGWRSRDEIIAAVEMLRHLHNGGLPVAYPLPRKDGAYDVVGAYRG